MEYLIVAVAVFIGVIVHAAVGFGGALIAAPILVKVVGLQTAVPVIALSGGVMTISVLIMGWKDVDFRSVRFILAGIVVGAPIGLFLLKTAPEAIMQIVLGFLILCFSIFLLTNPKLPELKSRAWPVGFGFAGGLGGAAFSIGGPPLILYGICQKWNPSEFRASLQAAFICMGMITVPGHFVTGLITKQVLVLTALSIPVTGLGLVIGNYLHKRIPPGKFDRIVQSILLIMGAMLMINGYRSLG
jgi:uncharacterized membrane protein YfcA